MIGWWREDVHSSTYTSDIAPSTRESSVSPACRFNGSLEIVSPLKMEPPMEVARYGAWSMPLFFAAINAELVIPDWMPSMIPVVDI